MKIAHFVGGNLRGGAARGAFFLHQSLKLRSNIRSYFFIADSSENIITDENFYILNKEVITSVKKYKIKTFENYLLRKYRKHNHDLFSLGFGAYDTEFLEVSKHVDIIHLHWINDCLISIEAINKIQKPIIWTFRDMWPFTGGCHYSKGCLNYTKSCGSCLLLKSNYHEDITRVTYERKLRIFNKSNIFPVAISRWLKECAEKSIILQNKNISLIPNCIDVNVFKAYDKMLTRNELNIPLNKKVILFGAIKYLSDPRKGFNYLVDALQNIKDKTNYYLITFGDSNEKVLKKLGFEYKNFGFVNDDNYLSKIYSSADVFVTPSLEEAFGKTIIESMSCGTPVVAFNSTGPKDIIKHKENGYLARNKNSVDLLNGIKWVIENKDKFINNVRKTVVENYSFEVVSNKYIKLYEKVLNMEKNQNKRTIINTEDIKFSYWMKTNKEKFYNYLEHQLNKYNIWYIFDQDRIEKLVKSNKVAIYGTGSFGKELLNVLNSYNIKIDCFIDSFPEKYGTYIDNIEIKSIEQCSNHFIIIASTWFKEIEKELMKKGIKKKNYIICMK